MTVDVGLKITMSREDLIAALKARLPWAREFDAREKAAYKAAQKEHLEKFRRELRNALKWSYAEASKHGFNVDKYELRRTRPSCPEPVTPAIKYALEQLKVSNQKSFTLSPEPGRRNLHWMLTHDETIAAEMKAVC